MAISYLCTCHSEVVIERVDTPRPGLEGEVENRVKKHDFGIRSLLRAMLMLR